jgi:DnaJ-class molecular chaperone
MKTRFETISEARKILELPESATFDHIRHNYKQLIKQWHPDKSDADPATAEQKTREIIRAYKIIVQYCREYRYSFDRQEVEKYLSDRERWFRQFGCDPIWAADKKQS